jgi:hypothetical protein
MRGERLTGLAVAAVLAIGVVAGCGGDDDDDAGASQDGGSEFVATGSDEQQIKQVLHGIQEDFDNVDAPAFCAKVSKAEKRDIIGYGRNFDKGLTCLDVIEKVARETSISGVEQKPTRFISAKVKGDRARVLAKDGPRPPEWLTFVKEGGHWKIADSGLDPDPIGAAKERYERLQRAKKRR